MNRMEKQSGRKGFAAALLFMCGVVLLCGCCRRKLDHGTLRGYVEIALDWSGAAAAPAGSELWFYPQDGSQPFKYNCQANVFRGELPKGTYRIIVHNTDAEEVSYRGMNSYSTAEVYANKKTEPEPEEYRVKAGSSTLISEPRQVYGTGQCGAGQTFEVGYRDTLNTTVSPVALTRTVSFRFDVTNMANIASVDGYLEGVAGGVYLATGKRAYGQSCTTAFTTTEVSGTGGTSYLTQIRVFGLSSQDEGKNGSNTACVRLTKEDGTVHETLVDISDAIRRVIDDNGGEIPLEIPVRIELTLIGTHLTAAVVSWDESGSGGGVVE